MFLRTTCNKEKQDRPLLYSFINKIFQHATILWSSETRCGMYHMNIIYIYIISECQSSYTCECLAHFT